MNIAFIINNRNNRLGKLLPRLERSCREAGLGNVQYHTTLRKKHAVGLARQAARDQCEVIVAVGGDGTLHEVVNGVFQSQIPHNAHPAIGLLPYGSANDFARSVGISKSVDRLLGYIESKSFQRIDLGKVSLHESSETRYFINIAGVGIGPEVVKRMESASGFFGPQMTYFTNILKAFVGYHKKKVVCRGEHWQWSGPLLQMAVANGSYFGNGICIAPDARLADGQFKIALFGDLSLWDYLRNFRKLKKGLKIFHPEVVYHFGRELELESHHACGIEADGEYIGLAPATFSVLPKAIRIVAPEGFRS